MSGPRTRYVICQIHNGTKYYLPLYNSIDKFIKYNIGPEVPTPTGSGWFITYVNGRKLYTPLIYPTISRTMETIIYGKKVSFVRNYYDINDLFPRLNLQMSINSYASGISYICTPSFFDSSYCYDWKISVYVTVAGSGTIISRKDLSRNDHNNWTFYTASSRQAYIEKNFNFAVFITFLNLRYNFTVNMDDPSTRYATIVMDDRE